MRLAGGEVMPRRVLAVSTKLVARAELLAGIGLEATEHALGVGQRIEADGTGRTAVPGVWVAGNVTDLMAWVAGAASAGGLAGAAINNDLIAEDTRIAVERTAAVRARRHDRGSGARPARLGRRGPETRPRRGIDSDGRAVTLHDGLVRARRRR